MAAFFPVRGTWGLTTCPHQQGAYRLSLVQIPPHFSSRYAPYFRPLLGHFYRFTFHSVISLRFYEGDTPLRDWRARAVERALGPPPIRERGVCSPTEYFIILYVYYKI